MHWEAYASRLCGFLFLQTTTSISLFLICLLEKNSVNLFFFFLSFPFLPQLKPSLRGKKKSNAFLVLNLNLVVMYVLITN